MQRADMRRQKGLRPKVEQRAYHAVIGEDGYTVPSIKLRTAVPCDGLAYRIAKVRVSVHDSNTRIGVRYEILRGCNDALRRGWATRSDPHLIRR